MRREEAELLRRVQEQALRTTGKGAPQEVSLMEMLNAFDSVVAEENQINRQ